MIVVQGWLRTAAEDRDAYLAVCLTAVRLARVAPGCLDFALSADGLDADRINVAERWTDAGSLAAFRSSGPSEDIASRILDASVGEYEVVVDPEL